jgi:orotidine-5'-phosphate decarboxylase
MSATTLSPRNRLIVALDFPSAALALAQVDLLEGRCLWFKVGLELYLAEGAGMVHALRDRGFEVFLDLKLHDIPSTVAGAVRSASRAGASLLTLHAGGGPVMLRAAAEAAAEIAGAPRLLAVTLLTSMDGAQLAAVGVAGSTDEQVLRLARVARESGIDGLVCSAHEVSEVRGEMGKGALLVVPGIRLAGGEHGDQKRVATPSAAIGAGASMLVVGRPITQAKDPGAAVEAFFAEMSLSVSARQ